MSMRRVLLLCAALLLLTAPAAALDGYDYYQTIDYNATDQSVYQQDIVIHRTTGTAYEETSGGLKIWHVFIGPNCRVDYGDIRFSDRYGQELAYYLWPDFDSSTARFCVRLEGANAAGALMVHYGNLSAATTSDGDATYLFFDDFNGDTLDSNKWTVSGQHYQVSGGILTVTARTSFTNYIISQGSFTGAAVIFETKAQSFSPGTGGYFGLANAGSSLTDVIVSFDTPDYRLDSRRANSGYHVGTAGSEERVWAAHWKSDSSAQVYENGEPYGTIPSNRVPRASVPLYIRFRGSETGSHTFDYVLVRAYSATPPSAAAFSTEQQTAAPPTAQFSATPTLGARPLTVQFTDTSTCSPTSWSWTFGDGNTSTDQNPTRTYECVGTYTVTLTATNEYGTDTETKTNYIDVGDPPVASFTASPSHGYAPLTVQFTDTSTNAPTSWSWTFGDGATSSAQNPTHTYTEVGTYTVTLTATNAYGGDTETTTITASTIYPFPGIATNPTDIDADGIYEDINGNGRLDFNDLTIFFKNLAWAKTNEPIEAFDFNSNGWIDYKDVILLFNEIKEAST